MLGVSLPKINEVTSLMAPAEGHLEQLTDSLVDPQPVSAADFQGVGEGISLTRNQVDVVSFGPGLTGRQFFSQMFLGHIGRATGVDDEHNHPGLPGGKDP